MTQGSKSCRGWTWHFTCGSEQSLWFQHWSSPQWCLCPSIWCRFTVLARTLWATQEPSLSFSISDFIKTYSLSGNCGYSLQQHFVFLCISAPHLYQPRREIHELWASDITPGDVKLLFICGTCMHGSWAFTRDVPGWVFDHFVLCLRFVLITSLWCYSWGRFHPRALSAIFQSDSVITPKGSL